MHGILEKIKEIGIVPVAAIEDEENVLACGGSWMAKGDFETVCRLSQEAVQIVKECRG